MYNYIKHIYIEVTKLIDEKKTFMLFKYTSVDLSHGSHKKVLVVCDECGQERLSQYIRYKNVCASCSHKGNKNHKGKYHTEETKCKISKAKTGKHHTEETKYKMSKNHADVSKENHPNWKGGKRLRLARASTKRRKLFGFIPHNLPQKNFHGHHLDFNHVIFIPKEIHISVSHSVINNKNMDLINDVACDWYLKYQLNYV